MRDQWMSYARYVAELSGLDPDAFVQQLDAQGVFDSSNPADAIASALDSGGQGGQYYAGVQPRTTPPPAPAEPPTGTPPQGYSEAEEPSQQPIPVTPSPVVTAPPPATPSIGATPPEVYDPTSTASNLPAPGAATVRPGPRVGPADNTGSVFDTMSSVLGAFGSATRYPWEWQQLGGPEQASLNLARELGLEPDSGNPVARFITSMLGPMAEQAKLKLKLAGTYDQMGSEQAIADLVKSTLGAGKRSVFDDIPGALRQMASLDRNTPLGTELSDPRTAANTILMMNSGMGSPFLQRYYQEAMKRGMSRYYNAAEQQPNLGPFNYLLGQSGY